MFCFHSVMSPCSNVCFLADTGSERSWVRLVIPAVLSDGVRDERVCSFGLAATSCAWDWKGLVLPYDTQTKVLGTVLKCVKHYTLKQAGSVLIGVLSVVDCVKSLKSTDQCVSRIMTLFFYSFNFCFRLCNHFYTVGWPKK